MTETDPTEVRPDERKASILRAVVEEYIQTAKPVGSTKIAKLSSIEVSPATVRNEMAALEAEGYLMAPHTSAGRIPTDKGYRLFVDALTEDGPGKLGRIQSAKVDDFFAATHGEIERMLRDTTRLLSSITNHAAVVVADSTAPAQVCSVQLVGLTPDVALAVFVLSDGAISKFSMERTADMTDDVLDDACAALRGLAHGKPLSALSVPFRPAGGPETTVDVIVGSLVAAIGSAHREVDDELFVGGAANMATDFETVGTVREVLSILEQQLVVVSLVREVLGRGRQVAIGTETGVDPLAECALVVAPYHVDGEKTGSIGILGPTRMDYSQALAAVAIVSRGLGERLGSG